MLRSTNSKPKQKQKLSKLTTLKKHPQKQQKCTISNNKFKRLVPTKKRLMLEVPVTPTITELQSIAATTSFDIPTTSVSFSHPLPSVDVATHPLIQKPTNIQGQMFAIIDVNGSQHKVTKDDQIMVNHLKDVEIGEQLAFEHVYLLAGRDFTVLGKPWVPNVHVIATVEQHTLLAPVTVWKYKRRTGYRNLNRSRDHVTILRIDDVVVENTNDLNIIPQVSSLDTIQLNVMKPDAATSKAAI